MFQPWLSSNFDPLATGTDSDQGAILEDPFLSGGISAPSFDNGQAPLDLMPPWQPDMLPVAPSAIGCLNNEFYPPLDSPDRNPSWATQPSLPPPASPRHQQQLPRRRSRYLRQNQYQPEFSSPIDIPGRSSPSSSSARAPAAANDTLDPMQRWQESPPHDEAASLSAIADALAVMPLRSARSSTRSVNSHHRALSGSRPASIHSHGSATSCSSASGASLNASLSRRSSHHERTSSRGGIVKKAKGSRKSLTTAAAKDQDGDKRRCFPCTFCCDTFKSKYDWSRHEKSLHLNLEGWRCTPFGAVETSPDTGQPHCAYCSVANPTPAHLAQHNHGSCRDNRDQPPVFARKDHLTQHLRLVHAAQKPPPGLARWKAEPPPVTSRCGFCNRRLQTWQERVDHLAGHFKRGFSMDDWKGDHDFEPSVAARVANAMPPYILGAESRVPVPFSATGHGTKDHLLQIQTGLEQEFVSGPHEHAKTSSGDRSVESHTSPNLSEQPAPKSHQTDEPTNVEEHGQHNRPKTFPELLVLHLGRYAREQMRLGVMPTDEMFQNEARRITYDSVDPWDQTIADNQDWMSSFRSRHLRDGEGEGQGPS